MKVELKHRDGIHELPVPYNVGTNEVNLDLLDFMVYRKKHPKLIHKNLRAANTKTVTDAAQRIVYFINLLAQQKYKINGVEKIGVDYCIATYEGNMKPIIDDLRKVGWKENSLEQYVKAWRQFYRFLTFHKVDHRMFMPDTVEVERKGDQDDNFLSHTNVENTYKGEQETAIDDKNKAFKETYIEDVIAMETFWALYAALYDIDEVYAVMAYCQLSTLLRVEALVKNVPLAPTKLNPSFKPYELVKRRGIEEQVLRYVAKGGKKKQTVLISTVQKTINDEYIDSDICNYDARLKKYREDYSKTKWAKKAHRTEDIEYSWLNNKGTPVSIREYQTAFEKASAVIGVDVHSHMMRHTGVTQLLWRFLVDNNQSGFSNELLVNDAHTILQGMLGHVNISTTRMYTKTVDRMISGKLLSITMKAALSVSKEHHEDLVSENEALSQGLSAMERALKEYEGFMRGNPVTVKAIPVR
jgi:site-specific recombinase XerC